MFNKHDTGKIMTLKQNIGSDNILGYHHPRLWSSSWSAVPPACPSSVTAAYYVPRNPSLGKIIYYLIYLILVENVAMDFFKQGNTKTLGKLLKSLYLTFCFCENYILGLSVTENAITI